jgi:hypothetical protein
VDLIRGNHVGRWIYLGIYGEHVRGDVYRAQPELYERFAPSRMWGGWPIRVRYSSGVSRSNFAVQIEMPVGMALAALALPPALVFGGMAIRTRRRDKRAAEHRCLVCGYDLRATPQRCPECGAAVTHAGSETAIAQILPTP